MISKRFAIVGGGIGGLCMAIALQRKGFDVTVYENAPVVKPLGAGLALAGNAAHATTPNMGQGACMAIEDAAVLSNCLDQYETAEQAFQSFEAKRIKPTTTIVNNSRTIGAIAQWQNPLLTRLHNALVRSTPPSITEKQMRFLVDVSFT